MSVTDKNQFQTRTSPFSLHNSTMRALIVLMLAVAGLEADLFSSSPTTKIWTQDTNFETASNWDDEELPCSNQRVVFPATMSLSVFLQTNTSIREMVLPMDGEISFGPNMQLAIGVADPVQYSCPNNDAKFRSRGASDWYSPQSWKMENETMTDPAPVPELERIPCQYDHAVFPANISFKAKLAGPPISFRSLNVAGENMNTSSFAELTETTSGKLRFERVTTVDINQQNCADVTGCVCRSNTKEVEFVVCQLANCPLNDCTDPVKPVGSCCYRCGSVVTTQHGKEFVWTNLHKLYTSFLAKSEYTNIQGYISKIDDNHVQAVFTDSAVTHRSTQIAMAIKEYIEADINGLRTLGIVSISIQTSSHWIAHHLIGEGLSVGSVMGLVFGFIAVVVLALVALAMYRTRCVINLPFGRLYDEFKEESTAVHFDAAAEAEEYPTLQRPLATIEGFDNPMYQTPSGQPPSYEDTSFGPGGGTVEIRQNPVFMAFGEEEDEDSQ